MKRYYFTYDLGNGVVGKAVIDAYSEEDAGEFLLSICPGAKIEKT